jgi:hypothetical protein
MGLYPKLSIVLSPSIQVTFRLFLHAFKFWFNTSKFAFLLDYVRVNYTHLWSHITSTNQTTLLNCSGRKTRNPLSKCSQ